MDECRNDRGLHLYPSCVDGCGYADEIVQTGGVDEAVGVGVELVPPEVVGHRQTPVLHYLVDVGRRHIELLLPVAVVDGQLCGVPIYIMCTVEGILRHEKGGEP